MVLLGAHPVDRIGRRRRRIEEHGEPRRRVLPADGPSPGEDGAGVWLVRLPLEFDLVRVTGGHGVSRLHKGGVWREGTGEAAALLPGDRLAPQTAGAAAAGQRVHVDNADPDALVV